MNKFRNFIETSDWDDKAVKLYEKASLVLVPLALVGGAWVIGVALLTIWRMP